ncbi:MAG: deoxynucleoside kinase [Betaproteobacteria bacterium]|nr:deoxynucleoside kinase [Betaproteobacteria bacterium]NBS92335.1 deoxynucleoside kinase [Betaproteobacteria bacterium]NBY52791.1 deoxynucleoside kinase [Betaproteobacteria bacterium]NCA23691.1 deoxynucleoside kinase [Betaproteobacteria bacterium]NCU85716.1 deoxynucleoside kinase [Betaproteobacteria bacterium]
MTAPAFRHVVVEGPIGAGKTSLARRLADTWGGELLLEEPSENPFLPLFYKDMRRYALPTQLSFLFQRAEQLKGLSQPGLFSPLTVCDFLLDKDPLFARLNLDDAEFELYQTVFDKLAPDTPPPDLVIYLQAPVQALTDRVRRRGVGYEQGMQAEYLARLAEAYSRFFHAYEAAPVLIVNSTKLNFVEDDEAFAMLLQRITQMRGQREFFSRG